MCARARQSDRATCEVEHLRLCVGVSCALDCGAEHARAAHGLFGEALQTGVGGSDSLGGKRLVGTDGAGEDLITELSQAVPRVAVIIGISGDADGQERALAAGADAYLPKPIAHVGQFQETILRLLPPERQPNGPRPMRDDTVQPDPVAYRDDMSHVAELLDEAADGPMLDYVAQFLSGVARAASDDQLEHAAAALAQTRQRGGASQVPVAQIAGLLQERIAGRAVI